VGGKVRKQKEEEEGRDNAKENAIIKLAKNKQREVTKQMKAQVQLSLY
jgi:hypothetical protein